MLHGTVVPEGDRVGLPPEAALVLAVVVLSADQVEEGSALVGLEADDFLVREENQLRTTLDAWPAVYPVAILVDNTQNARADFIQIRSAVHQFVGSLSGREVALYSFGDRATRIVDFTTDLKKVEKATENLFALPESESHVLDAVIEAARDIRKREVPVAAIVMGLGWGDLRDPGDRPIGWSGRSGRSGDVNRNSGQGSANGSGPVTRGR